MVQHFTILLFQLESGIILRFNAYIKNITKTGDKYPITLEFDDATFRVTICLANQYQLDLRSSSFNKLIGFDKNIIDK